MKAGMVQGKKAEKCLCKRVTESLLFLTVRAGGIITKILDICFFPEFMDLLWKTVKPGTRGLTPLEKQEARKVFGDSINYQQVLIDESSIIAWLGAKKNKCWGMGVTTFHTINFNKKLKTATANQNMKWLIHELTHVSQMEHAGSKYMVEAFYARMTEGYGYVLGTRPHLREYNREQQASIAADYYISLASGRSTTAYDPYIAELQAGEL